MTIAPKKISLADAPFRPRPVDRDLPKTPAQWISEGSETAVQPAAKKEKTRRISLDIPESMHYELRLYCAQHRTDAAAMIRRFLTRTLARNKAGGEGGEE
jgi:hypothetical protein